jgi:hypothetical protein
MNGNDVTNARASKNFQRKSICEGKKAKILQHHYEASFWGRERKEKRNLIPHRFLFFLEYEIAKRSTSKKKEKLLRVIRG